MVAVGAVKSGRGLGRRQERRPNTSKARTRQTSQAAAAAPRPRKASKHAAEDFRALGKRQNAPLKVSEASEGSKHAAEDFRRLGASGTPAKFAGYGLLRYPANFPASAEAVRDTGQVCRVRAFEVSGKASAEAGKNEKSPIGAGLFR